MSPRSNRDHFQRNEPPNYRREEPAHIPFRPNLGALTKPPREILATERHLNLPTPPPTGSRPRRETSDKFCEYHREQGHMTNECRDLRKQLGFALEAGKLDHLVSDGRQHTDRRENRGPYRGNGKNKSKVINMVRTPGGNKRGNFHHEEEWMKVSITFPPLLLTVRRTNR